MMSSRCNWMQEKLLMVVLVIFRQGITDFTVDAEMVEGCVGTTLQLYCVDYNVLQISSVVLGDSECLRSNCCIKPNDCTASPNDDHVQSVHSRCNGQPYCPVKVIKEEIKCGLGNTLKDNDFERITYNCVDSVDAQVGIGPTRPTMMVTKIAGHTEISTEIRTRHTTIQPSTESIVSHSETISSGKGNDEDSVGRNDQNHTKGPSSDLPIYGRNDQSNTDPPIESTSNVLIIIVCTIVIMVLGVSILLVSMYIVRTKRRRRASDVINSKSKPGDVGEQVHPSVTEEGTYTTFKPQMRSMETSEYQALERIHGADSNTQTKVSNYVENAPDTA